VYPEALEIMTGCRDRTTGLSSSFIFY